jgi:hypothetical protein
MIIREERGEEPWVRVEGKVAVITGDASGIGAARDGTQIGELQ